MKKLTAGSEIDAWCTKCRMDLGHTIVAMVPVDVKKPSGDQVPKRVQCKTCNSEHNYRAPKNEAKRPASLRKDAPKKKGSAAAATKAAETAHMRARDWEMRITGQPVDAFIRYGIDKTFRADQLITHTKFGEGFVVEVLDAQKISIMFRDGPRVLAHGKQL